jgi:UDP-sugar transporter A1/2/3
VDWLSRRRECVSVEWIRRYVRIYEECISVKQTGIYFEKILKSSANVSVWLRNVQLSVCALPIALVTAYAQNGREFADRGFLYGFDALVWLGCWYRI